MPVEGQLVQSKSDRSVRFLNVDSVAGLSQIEC